jgi:chromosome condensin MukBEF ATPase and DNA-binding subunit MukB
MADDPDNLVLVYLRRLDEKVDRIGDDVRELKGRMTALEESVVGVQRRMDRLDLRLDRVEKRLDLADLPR